MSRSRLVNRFTITFGLVAVAIALWNGYVAMHDSGLIAGRVVGPDGSPVAGATVALAERTLLVTRPKAATVTDADGRFVFDGQDLYRLYLAAEKTGVGVAPATEYRLMFKGQELILDAPLRLEAEDDG